MNRYTGATLSKYTAGFTISLIITLVAFLMVTHHTFAGWITALVIAALALVQFAVQLWFFLHPASGGAPRWKLYAMLFMLVVVVILVAGSLWIMYSLNYRMNKTPAEINQYMNSQAGI